MIVEPYCAANHYHEIMSWFEARGMGELIDPCSISPFGAVAIRDDQPIMAGFLYLAVGTNVAFMERFIARPGNTLVAGKQAGGALVEVLRNIAMKYGYRHIYANVANPVLARIAEQWGFRSQGPAQLIHKQLN